MRKYIVSSLAIMIASSGCSMFPGENGDPYHPNPTDSGTGSSSTSSTVAQTTGVDTGTSTSTSTSTSSSSSSTQTATQTAPDGGTVVVVIQVSVNLQDAAVSVVVDPTSGVQPDAEAEASVPGIALNGSCPSASLGIFGGCQSGLTCVYQGGTLSTCQSPTAYNGICNTPPGQLPDGSFGDNFCDTGLTCYGHPCANFNNNYNCYDGSPTTSVCVVPFPINYTCIVNADCATPELCELTDNSSGSVCANPAIIQ
jgi:hypothetical protein